MRAKFSRAFLTSFVNANAYARCVSSSRRFWQVHTCCWLILKNEIYQNAKSGKIIIYFLYPTHFAFTTLLRKRCAIKRHACVGVIWAFAFADNKAVISMQICVNKWMNDLPVEKSNWRQGCIALANKSLAGAWKISYLHCKKLCIQSFEITTCMFVCVCVCEH